MLPTVNIQLARTSFQPQLISTLPEPVLWIELWKPCAQPKFLLIEFPRFAANEKSFGLR